MQNLPDPTALKADTLDDVLGQAEIFGADRVKDFVLLGIGILKLINERNRILRADDLGEPLVVVFNKRLMQFQDQIVVIQPCLL